MNYRTLGEIGVRLLATWMIASGIALVPQLVNVWCWGHLFADQTQSPVSAEFWMRFVYTLVTVDRLVIGILLWVLASWLSRRLVPAAYASPSEVSSSVLVQGSISVAGLVISVTAIPTLVTRAITTPGFVLTVGYPYAAQGWTYLGVQGILILLGLGMIFGARRLHNLIFRPSAASTGSAGRFGRPG